MQMQPQQRGGGGNMINMDRSSRSIFVGNISYDVPENEVRQVLTQVGQVVSFRIVHDRETGRPKGFGFCEFADTSSVDLALRNLNGYEIHGRPLRVDSATGGDRSADEVQQFQMLSSSSAGGAGSMNIGVGGGPGGQMSSSSHHQINGNSSSNIGGQDGSQPSGQQQLQPQSDELNPYGPVPEPGKAPEAIARVVSSYPPEKIFQLMKDMKEMVNTNSQQARQWLVENPQFAYALLQAQVVMRVVDPKVAYSMLHRETPSTVPFHQLPMGVGDPSPPLGGPSPGGPPPIFGQPPPGHGQQRPPVMPGPGVGIGPLPPFQQQPGGGAPPPMFRGPPPPQGMSMPSMGIPPPGMLMTHGGLQQRQMAPPSVSGGQSAGVQMDDVEDEESQAQMLVKLLQLTDDQIRMLPPEDRHKVQELRAQLRQQLPG